VTSDSKRRWIPAVAGMTRSALLQGWGVLLLLVLWQLYVVITGFNAIVMPRPIGVLQDLVREPDAYWGPALRTIAAAALGMLLGLLLGTLLAVAAWLSKILEGLLLPLTVLFSSVPVVTLIPIIARLLGQDFSTVLAIVVIICFFPAFVFTSSGLRALPPGAEDLFKVLGAGTWVKLLRLALPSALPNWMVALRITAGHAVLAAMVAEYLMGTAGLGFLFGETKADFNMERAFGTTVVATIVSMAFFLAATAAERHVKKRWT
jgi:ABC-type nitrate/sulfonate/bicarbonate transport system permease component